MGYSPYFVQATGRYQVRLSGDMTKAQARAEANRLNFTLQVKTRRDALNYIREHGERGVTGAHGEQILDTRSHGVGLVVYSAEDALYLLDYTGSDVPEWAVVAYRITDHIDHLTGVLSADTKRAARTPDYPDGRTLDCGCTVYWAHEVMSASNGTSCARCYDRMS